VHQVDRSYAVGDRVFLRVKPHNISIKFGNGDKLSPRLLAYRLDMLDSLRCMHDVFHVSVLRHYVSDPTHVIDMGSLQVSNEGALTMERIHILDHHI